MNLLSHNEIRFTLDHIFKVAGVTQTNVLKIDFSSFPNGVSVDCFEKNIFFTLSDNEQIKNLLSGTLNLSNIPTADACFLIPVILDADKEFCTLDGNGLVINADIISISFIMLSRFEETLSTTKDIFGNYRAVDSIASKYNFIDYPIVDEYAKILQFHLQKILPKSNFRSSLCKLIPTHDIDELFRYSFSFLGIRRIIKDILFSKNLKEFIYMIRLIFNSLVNNENDPFFQSIYKLHQFSDGNNLAAEFYFMAADKNKYNSGYNLFNKHLKKLFTILSSSNMIIGLHGGYGTRSNPKLLLSEKKNLDNCLSLPTSYGRQHYLHFDVNNTFGTITHSGIKYDSTLGYNEREGFRTGTCHSYLAWNFAAKAPHNLVVRPLIAMDLTFWQYETRSKKEAYDKIIFLYNRCKYVGGDFIINWHNVYVLNRKDWFYNVYCKAVRYIVSDLNTLQD